MKTRNKKIKKYRDQESEDFCEEYGMYNDHAFKEGFDKALDLELPVKFAQWVGENYTPNGRPGHWDSNELNESKEPRFLFDTTESLYDHWLETVYEIE